MPAPRSSGLLGSARPVAPPARGRGQRAPAAPRAFQVSQTASQAASTPPKALQLSDPARLGGTHRAVVEVQELPPHLSLEQYMRLSTEQYSELDPTLIRPLGGSSFILHVPRVTLFGAWLEPQVQVEVVQAEAPPRVTIAATSCRLVGSEVVQRMGLDRRFALRFVTELTWRSSHAAAGHPPAPSTAGNSSSAGSASGHDSPGRSSSASSSIAAPTGRAAQPPAPPRRGEIHGALQLDVWSEVVPPFHLIPRDALQAGGNAVLGTLMRTLLPMFMRRLGEDYERWCRDEGYRRRRAARLQGEPR